MTSTYPDKNPFPYQGTMTVEASAEIELEGSYQIPRTLRLDPLKKTLKHIKNYLGRFNSSEAPQGQFVALRGDHGSGKTHALKFAIEWVKHDPFEVNMSACEPAQLYAQSKTPDFLFVYKQLISQISIEELQELNIRFLGIVASEQIGKTSNDEKAKDEIASKLRENPSKIFELFNSYLVEEGAVQERQKAEVKSLSSAGGDDFRRAFSYILSPELSSTAYNWVTAQSISNDDARRLGVSGPITSAETGVLALQLLAALFNRIDRPLIIYIDQYEKLILSGDKVLAPTNAGLLQSLVELVPKADGMIVLAGNEEAWDALPRDLRSRFAGNVVDFPVLKPEEALRMIRLYLSPAAADFEPSSSGATVQKSGNMFFPFEETAAKTIVSYSAGNIRRLLQMCSTVFEAAAPEKRLITTSLVDKVLAEGNLAYYSYENVRDEIERILVDNSLKFVRASRIGGVEADLSVVDNSGEPLLLIQISEATFHEQEAQQALATLSRVQRIRQQGIQAPIVFIALGYVSNEVTRAVREFVQDVVIYKPELLAGELGKILQRIDRAAPTAPDASAHVKMLEEQLVELSTKLEEVLRERKAESNVVESRLAQFFERQAADRLEEKRQSARPAWAVERGRIEKEIKEARQQRRQNELHELERLRDRAEKSHRRRTWLCATLTLFVLVLTLVVFTIGVVTEIGIEGGLLNGIPHRLTAHVDGWIVLFTFTFSIIVLIRASDFVGPSVYRELSTTVSSKEELDRLAHQLAQLSGEQETESTFRKSFKRFRSAFMVLISPFPQSTRGLLNHPNPHYRYAGVVKADPSQHLKHLLRLLKAERSTIIRRLIAQRVGKVIKSSEALEELSANFIPELAYIIDSAGHKMLEGTSETWPPPLNILASLYGAEPRPRSRNLALVLAEGQRRKSDEYGLFDAFQNGLERASLSPLGQIPEVRVRPALRLLSPFEEGGLGTLDELNAIKRIDEFFLFFRQLLFFIERDLLPTPLAEEFSRG